MVDQDARTDVCSHICEFADDVSQENLERFLQVPVDRPHLVDGFLESLPLNVEISAIDLVV